MLSTPALFTFQNLLLVAAFAVLGAGIKFVDDAFDKKRYNKRVAIAVC